ncbi:hypothetical protein TRVL_00912 [Trypanosoma vivax]|uniref:Uncharacterized protein n=1 Tax=Trypanosoma vivax (strain Y486) TaxID=1055687 RepID=G0U3B3_TRYVY|nr:hypothetical protein TRVL_00912 [Trypanosoma vivax]CCC50769.1 hypothetical protein, unlikely [Trypanosoma vivax Y486]
MRVSQRPCSDKIGQISFSYLQGLTHSPRLPLEEYSLSAAYKNHRLSSGPSPPSSNSVHRQHVRWSLANTLDAELYPEMGKANCIICQRVDKLPYINEDVQWKVC